MANPTEIRRRVERLLIGERDTANLDRIFLWLRTRSYGRKSVRDLGDFVAHSDKRDQGNTWESTKALYSALRHYSDRLTLGFSTRDDVVAAMEGLARIERPDSPRRKIGIGQKKAHRILKGLIPRIEKYDGREMHVSGALTPEEEKVINYYSNSIEVNPVFTQDQLVAELSEVLLRHGLLDESELDKFADCAELLGVYTVSKMHLCDISYGDKPPLTLQSRVHEEGYLEVGAIGEVRTGPDATGFVHVAVFISSAKGADWCFDELLASNEAWTGSVELVDGRLKPV